jgi:hypothetical protein
VTEREATAKAKGCAVSAAFSDLYSSILANWTELTAVTFPQVFGLFCVGCGVLHGFGA